jgi:hypothetical protein
MVDLYVFIDHVLFFQTLYSVCYNDSLCNFRWNNDLQQLKGQRVRLLGDCLIGSAFLSYVGAFSWEFRNDLVNLEWLKNLKEKGVPLSDPFKLEDLLTNDVEISKYDTCLIDIIYLYLIILNHLPLTTGWNLARDS